MYRLTLSQSERQAIDWIGDRYSHGYDLFALLWRECQQPGNDIEWDAAADIEFAIPEHVAWQIGDLIEADSLACFAPALQAKLYAFQGQIV